MKPSFYTNKKGEQVMEFRVFKSMDHGRIMEFLHSRKPRRKKPKR